MDDRRFSGLCALPLSPSQAVGVGKLGEQEQTVSPVGCPKATGAQSEGQHSIAQSFQLRSESMPRPGSIGSDNRRIFPQNIARAKHLKNADELMTKRRLKGLVMTWPCIGVLLTRISSAHQIDTPRTSWIKGSDISPPPLDVWEPEFKDSLAVSIVFNLPPARHAGSFKAKVHAADACEETPEGHSAPPQKPRSPSSPTAST